MLRDAIRAALPKEQFGDHLPILSGTGQNIAGLGIFVAATFATNVLISRAFGTSGPSALGTVTLATPVAFIAGAATRFGMDMAAVRRVAIDVGKGEPGRVRSVVTSAAAIAAAVSVAAGLLVVVAAAPLARAFGLGEGGRAAFVAAGVALPLVGVCQVYRGAPRGRTMRGHPRTVTR